MAFQDASQNFESPRGADSLALVSLILWCSLLSPPSHNSVSLPAVWGTTHFNSTLVEHTAVMSQLQSQFNLSLELTQVAPPLLTLAGKSWEAAMRLARELQGSGSDIVVEEDMATLFGRCTVSPNLSSTFRTLVSKSDVQTSILKGIALVSGAGPTVIRALTQSADGAYFAMVVQCMLCSAL
jgi:hypothetical protein